MSDHFAEAEQVLAELRAALRSVGVILPSLRIDLASTVAGQPLIDLGRANLDTARKLARAIQKASGAESVTTAEHQART